MRIVRGAQLLPEPFLDIQSRVTTEGEQGLLSVAFHPDYRRNGRLFVSYNMPLAEGSRSVIAEYRADPMNPDRALPRERVILTLAQPNLPIHKGGQLQFGPDGYLYLSFGDGDQPIEAQELDSFYGKILRLDVDASGVPYAIPPDNPFVGRDGVKGEIWAYGLRNPWRFSLDPCTSELFVGDVGLTLYEEVNLIEPGHNYGWPIAQVDLCGRPVVLGSVSCEGLGLALPINSYRHLTLDEEGGNSVIGGYIYRGKRFPQLRGRYLFTDLVSTKIWSLTRDASGKWQRDTLGQGSELISALGLDDSGELFALGYQEGTLYRLEREEIDFAEGNLEVTATPKTIALKNLSLPFNGLRQGRAGQSEIEFYLDAPQSMAFYFEALSPLRGQMLTVALNSRAVGTYRFGRGPQFDWLMLQGKKGRNELVLRYRIAQPEALRFTALELEALELED